ncbi:SDR family NAD(P)-dependent oxidoreductase [Sphingomonas sp. SUN039]|uniref:SDR family NAD(P)-dependent oxidoreductase n=1 Tax=Sphingomonas sp. SUN039 TaxID=2937787 RepID=UPI002164DD92|nr:SDR family oxidoreductase [Sphingomonas sp. SUN039]UVO54327.1 SDR family oxidoreductase [Sphingomonas sp. SUN039]
MNILLTGGTRGIGAAIATRLADHNVFATGSADGDFADPATPAKLWAAALDRFDGRIDVLINNAGIFEATPIDLPDADWSAGWARTMQVNLTASAELCRFAVQHFLSQGGGRIVNIASRAAHRGDSPAHWHYAASKGGMVAMTKTIARAYAAQGIYAFAVCPGFTMTGMAEDYLASRGGDKLLADIPLGKVADPEEVAEVAAFCATSAPPSMTGAVLDINGASYVR